MNELRKLSGEPGEAAFFDGYHQGHLDTVKMISRRSLLYLFMGGFLGVATMLMVFQTGLIAEIGKPPKVVEDPALSVSKPKDFVKAIDWAKRYTVGIIAESRAGTRGPYGGRMPGQQHIGSGIVLNAEGYVLTNSHVIPDSVESLRVVLGEKAYEARFVGRRTEYDIAIIKILADDLVPASLGDSDSVEQGDVVIAIGSPYGLLHTATEGIISYVGREGTLTNSLVPNYLQTSAAINSGNSGGPLIDLTGRVIGINTWKVTGGQEGADGLGFAIPINVARKVADRILAGDDKSRDARLSAEPTSVRTAFLGIRTAPDGLRTERGAGVMIEEVIPNTPAERAELQAGDVITAIAGKAVTDRRSLLAALEVLEPGQEVEVTIMRGGDIKVAKVTLDGR